MKLEIIEIREVQPYGFTKIHYGAGKCSLKIGNVFDLKGLMIYFSPLQKRIFLRSFSGNTFIDRHLEASLKEAVLKFCNGKNAAELPSFLNGEGKKFPDGPAFVPEGWEDNPLTLRVDYVELSNIQGDYSRENLVTARVCIGDYIKFFGVPIYDPIKKVYIEQSVIKNEAISGVINKLIKSRQTRHAIDSLHDIDKWYSAEHYVCFEDIASSIKV